MRGMDLRYPVGPFTLPQSSDDVSTWIDTIDRAPAELRRAVAGLTEAQLDTPYREGGWTARQVVHHLPDSHMNGYVRHKLALTEDSPVIRPYIEPRWAELEEARSAPVEISLRLLETLHARWVMALRCLDAADLERTYQHPEMGSLTLFQSIANYAWHSRHHIAHITSLRQRMQWGTD